MLIRLLRAHEMTKHVYKISRLNSKRLLRKLHKMLGATLFCRTLYMYCLLRVWIKLLFIIPHQMLKVAFLNRIIT